MKKSFFCCLLLIVSSGVIATQDVHAEDNLTKTKESETLNKETTQTDISQENEKEAEEAYNAAIAEVEKYLQIGVLTEEQRNEIVTNLINSVSLKQIEDNMTKFYLKYDVFDKLEFNQRLVNMQNYIQSLINKKLLNNDDGQYFINRVGSSVSYEGLNQIQSEINNKLSEVTTMKNETYEDYEKKAKIEGKLVENVSAFDTSNKKKKEEGATHSENVATEKNNQEKPVYINSKDKTAVLPQTGSMSQSAIFSLIGFFTFLLVFFMIEFKPYFSEN